MKRVLGIFAHPDDEVIFGWPIFQREDIDKYLMICCDDVKRKGIGRKQALREVCQNENITLCKCLSEDNNFYALPTRRADYLLTDAIQHIEKAINECVEEIKPDYIFTHNPMGEYGHGAHKLIFQIVSQSENIENLIFTDICEKSNHWSSIEIPNFIKEIYYKNSFCPCLLQSAFYDRGKKIYDKYRAWTWSWTWGSNYPKQRCNLYILKERLGGVCG